MLIWPTPPRIAGDGAQAFADTVSTIKALIRATGEGPARAAQERLR